MHLDSISRYCPIPVVDAAGRQCGALRVVSIEDTKSVTEKLATAFAREKRLCWMIALEFNISHDDTTWF